MIYAKGSWLKLGSILGIIVWIAISLVLLNVGIRGLPIVVAFVLFWPLITYGLVSGSRQRIEGTRAGAAACGLAGNNAPMNTVAGFERWLKRNGGVRYSERQLSPSS
jgi:hypothetical protein